MQRLDGKVALVSGAARGIGAAIAEALPDNGAKVVLGDLLDGGKRESSRSVHQRPTNPDDCVRPSR